MVKISSLVNKKTTAAAIAVVHSANLVGKEQAPAQTSLFVLEAAVAAADTAAAYNDLVEEGKEEEMGKQELCVSGHTFPSDFSLLRNQNRFQLPVANRNVENASAVAVVVDVPVVPVPVAPVSAAPVPVALVAT